MEIHPFAVDAGFWKALEVREGNVDNLTLLTQNNKNKCSLELYTAQRHEFNIYWVPIMYQELCLSAGDEKVSEIWATFSRNA